MGGLASHTLMMNAHLQPDRPRTPSRFVDSAPCKAPESMAPVGWATLYMLMRRAISSGRYHWLYIVSRTLVLYFQ